LLFFTVAARRKLYSRKSSVAGALENIILYSTVDKTFKIEQKRDKALKRLYGI